MPVRHVVSLASPGSKTIAHLVERSARIAAGKADGLASPADRVVGI